jgi:serine/threonine protein kinase
MPVTEPSPTLRSDRGSFGAAADIAGPERGPAVSSGGAEFLGIPGRFKILSQIGNGGMGIVYRVRDLETGEIIALKLLKPEIASDPRMREELRKEVCLARKVTHRNVCRIHELYRSDAASCISMEYVDGETLLSKLRRAGALPVRDAVEIARQICAGLHEAHARGIVHRDLKPANIMIEQSGVVKIMDFGIARLSHETGQGTSTIVGTPEYMAPEQIEVKAMGPRTDIYSLGLLLYEMITGSQAFTGDSSIAVAIKQLRESPRRPSEIVSTLSPALEAVILKCLRKNSASRFQSIDQLDSALSRATANTAPNLIGTQIRLAVNYVTAKWRVLQPQLVRLGRELDDETNRLVQRIHSEYRKLHQLAIAFKASNPAESRRIQIAAIATGAILGVFLVSLVASRPSKYTPAAPEAMVAPSLQNTEAVVPISILSSPSTASVDADHPTPAATQQNAELNLPPDRSSNDPSTDVSSSPVAPHNNVSRSDAPTSEAAKTRAKTRPVAAPLLVKTKPATLNVKLTVPDGPSRPLPMDHASAAANPTATPVSLPAPQPAAAVSASSAQPATDKPASIAETYLEVGAFGDTHWADDAVERLSQMGFHAICVHKTLLWKQSYHVQVGPYTTSEQLDDAQQRLTAQGFKPRVVK